jgi:hypothetical protein
MMMLATVQGAALLTNTLRDPTIMTTHTGDEAISTRPADRRRE